MIRGAPLLFIHVGYNIVVHAAIIRYCYRWFCFTSHYANDDEWAAPHTISGAFHMTLINRIRIEWLVINWARKPFWIFYKNKINLQRGSVWIWNFWEIYTTHKIVSNDDRWFFIKICQLFRSCFSSNTKNLLFTFLARKFAAVSNIAKENYRILQYSKIWNELI